MQYYKFVWIFDFEIIWINSILFDISNIRQAQTSIFPFELDFYSIFILSYSELICSFNFSSIVRTL